MIRLANGTKRCLGCNELGPWDETGRCPSCYSIKRAQYDNPTYRTERDRFARLIETGCCLDCPRCHRPIDPDEAWDLDHYGGELHPSHRRCNRGAPHRAATPLHARFLLDQAAQQ